MKDIKTKIILSISLLFLFISVGYAADNLITVCTGKTVVIKLPSNATTGYQWEMEAVPNNYAIKLINSKYYADRTGRVGSGGVEVWKFKALKKGKTELLFKYVRPWEKGKVPAEAKVITVVVK